MIKKITIIVFILSILFLVSCTDLDNYVSIEDYHKLQNAFNESINDITGLKKDNSSLKSEKQDLENRLNLTEDELLKYDNLISNLNELLKNVYYIYQEKNDGSSSWGTGFSIEYEGNYYLITAGHVVDGEYGKFVNLGFRANFSNDWIYPKLLICNNDYSNRNDYAVFYINNMVDGFKVDNEKDLGLYVLGSNSINISAIRNSNNISIIGESGSPIIDYEGEIIGMVVTDIYDYYVKINTVIEAIDNLE